MLIFLKNTYQWKVTLFKIILLILVSATVCSFPITVPISSTTVSEGKNYAPDIIQDIKGEIVHAAEKKLKTKIKYNVLSANLKSIVHREYQRYFNTSWLNDDDPSHECLLGSSDFYLWWLNSSGHVRPSLSGKEENILDLSNMMYSYDSCNISELKVQMLSLANNNLTSIPSCILLKINKTLERLSLMGNNFKGIGGNDTNGNCINCFPEMVKLITLDMRDCKLEYIENGAFSNLNNLNKLILSYNKIRTIGLLSFSANNRLRHLDLSYNFEPKDENDNNSTERMEPFRSLVDGLFFKAKLFDQVLTKLGFLDLSHTKLHAYSGIALAYLGEEIEQLSLCYTQIPIIAEKMFSLTNLRVLDLSGNQGLPSTFSNTSLAGLENKLEILSFENAYVKHIHWIAQLTKLKILKLRRNNINSIPLNAFHELKQLKIIDLSSNHLSHWYERIINNQSIQVLDLRDNNINVLSKEMIRDFQMVNYLAIGRNMFICNCILKDFLNIALKNTIIQDCDQKELFMDSAMKSLDSVDQYDAFTRILNDYLSELKENHKTIDDYFHHETEQHPQFKIYDPTAKNLAIIDDQGNNHVNCNLLRKNPKLIELNGVQIPESDTNLYKVQLLDYSEQDYKCINSNSTKSYTVAELEPCSYVDTQILPTTDVPTDVLILYPILVVLSASVLIIFIYYRGYDIKYFCITCRNVTVLSLLDKDKRKLLNKKCKSEIDEYSYDVFVSYSEQNRDWVLDHLLPNIEQRDGINVCLHERDFKVGLSILENIISCIDQSRTILLVISQSFVSSNWCQFELHLAQHRLLETRREQLVLVLLESIPRISRPRTLQYLMRTKTYLKWPTEKRKKHGSNSYSPSDIIEQRKLFFKRLKQAIVEQS